MAYHVTIAQFEGPLDLLVQLVEANQLEVTAISAAAVTEQFMAVIEQLGDERLSEIGRYLDLAARLLLVKSLALLPGQTAQPEPEAVQLEQELELYRQNQRLAKSLSQRLSAGRRSYSRQNRPSVPIRPVILPSAAVLEQALQRLVEARPVWESQTPPKVTLAQMLSRVRTRLGGQPQPLYRMIEEEDGPSEVALLLVAILELVKNRQAYVQQSEAFGSIMVATHA